MAITGSYSTATGVDFNLIAYYSYTQDVSANTSKVTVTLKLKHRSIRATALSDSYLSVAGNKVSYNGKYIQYSDNLVETTLATKTVTVKHANDGKGSCVIKATFVFNGTYSGKSIGTLTINKTLTLKTIPRASGLSVPTAVNTGSSLKASISPSSSTFKHKVRFIISGTTKYTSGFIAAGTTSYSHTIPHSWSPDKSSKTMTVRLYTYDANGTLIASVDKTTTINVPSDIVPTISSVKATLVSGLDSNYVQGKSKVKLTVTAKAGDGSSLTTYYYNGKNISGSNTSYSSTSTTQTSSVIQSSGKLTYKVRVKDKRGRYSEWTSTSITVQPYSTPKIVSIKAQRCLSDGTLDNDGTYAKVTVKTSHASVNGANTASVILSNSKDNYASSTPIISSTKASNTYSNKYGSGFATNVEYTIKATITDEYGATHTASVPLKVAQRSLNIAKYGNGVAIGGLSTVTSKSASGKFECNWASKFTELMISTGGIRTEADGSSNKYFEARRTNPPDATDNQHKNVKMQMYVGDSGYPTVRNQYSTDDGSTWTTRSYLRLQDDGVYANGYRVPEVQHGNVKITPSAANTPTAKVITFAKEFSGSPDIVVSPHTSVPGTTLLGVGTAERSSTDCTIYVTRTNTTETTINWIAAY